MSNLSEQLRAVVSEALSRYWAPVDWPEAARLTGEFDSYLPKIVEMLLEGRDLHALGRHLAQLERVSLGLPSPSARCDRTAREIVFGYHCLLLCPSLRSIVEEELGRGNKILETSLGWPRDESVFIRLSEPVTAPIVPELERHDVNDPHYWKAEIYDRRAGHLLAW